MRIMRKGQQYLLGEIENPDEAHWSSARGFYDPEPIPDEELWFLPPDDHSAADAPYDLPLPQADRRSLIDLEAWATAEAALAGPMVSLGVVMGRLAERLDAGPVGWRHRLALCEAADLSWLAGDRVSMERLALWLTLRVGGQGDDAQALARAGWAARRLVQAPPPQDDLARFLGRTVVDPSLELNDPFSDWAELIGQGRALHPVSQAALSFHLWPALGFSKGHAGQPMIEAAVVASRLVNSAIDGLGFLPLAMSGAGALRGRGTILERLASWIAGAEQATRAALRQLELLQIWDAEAKARVSGLSGRTPPALIEVFRSWPLVSAPLAESETGASRAAVQRNLNLLTEVGLIREVTGQGRYRFWTVQASRH